MKFIFAILMLFSFSFLFIDNVYAELDYSDLQIDSKSTLLFEGKDTNIIVVTIDLTNNGNESFGSSWIGNNFYLVSSNTYFDSISYLGDDYPIGDKACPDNPEIPAKVTRELTFCYEVSKNFPNSSYSIELLSADRDWCEEYGGNQYFSDQCQSITKSIKSPTKTDYDEYKKKFILKNTDIKIDFNSIELIEQPGFNILKIDFDVTNISSDEIDYYTSNVFATANEISYTSERYDLTNLGYGEEECQSYGIEINPKLTKSYSYCFEVPQGNNIFDLSIREGNFDSCDGGYSDCTEYILNISNPKFVALDAPKSSVSEPDYVRTNQISIVPNSSVPGCQEEYNCYSPWHVVAKNGETITWYNDDSAAHTVTSGYSDFFYDDAGIDDVFDSGLMMSGESFSYTLDVSAPTTYEYFCLVHPWMDGSIKVEYTKPTPTTTQPTSSISNEPTFVDKSKDPQTYVDRYNNEPEYKKWFDDNYSQYSSIEEAVGLTLTEKIPSWVKNIFGWYAQDQVSEDELLNAIKYLINQKILIVD